MKKFVLVTLIALEAIGASAQKWVGVPENRSGWECLRIGLR